MGKHYVPRWLLKQFEDPEKPGFIWMFDKKGSTPVQASIAQVAQTRDFYDPETEKRLNTEIEMPGTKAIQKLLSRELMDESQQMSLITYIAVMIKRVPYHRTWVAKLAEEKIPQLLDEIGYDLREEFQACAVDEKKDAEWIQQRQEWVNDAIKKFTDEPPSSVTEQINDPFPSIAIINALKSMTWRILEAKHPDYFVISDNPAPFFRWQNYGLGGKETEIVLPLSKKTAIHGSYQAALYNFSYPKHPPIFVREINKRVVLQASRFVFAHKKPTWMPKLLENNNLGYMRLGW